MTKGEDLLRTKMWAYIQGSNELEQLDIDAQADLMDAMIDIFKEGDYFVHLGEIREVGWNNYIDDLDTGVVYTLRCEYSEDELAEMNGDE